MKTVVAVAVLLCAAAACAERNVFQRGYVGRAAAANQPYWFLGGQRGKSNAMQAIQVPVSAADFIDDEEDDDDQEETFTLVNDDEDEEISLDDDLDEQSNDDDDDQELTFNNNNVLGVVPINGANGLSSNYWRSILAKAGGNAGSIMVPDGVIELEGQGIVDEETGETSLYLPREALAGIPDGSVVALIEDPESLGKAQKVYIRRRRKGGKRRGNKRGGNRRRRRGGNRRRKNTVRVIRPKPIRVPTGGNRRGNQRRRVPNVIRI